MTSVALVRQQCRDELSRLYPSKPEYFRELEGRIFDISGRPQSIQQMLLFYYRKYVQLSFNLKQYASNLTARYTPSELVHLGENELNSRVRQERDHNQEQHRLYKHILSSGNVGDGQDEEDDEGCAEGNRCPKCKNTKNISINLRQLRGGDEPMSVFYTCNNVFEGLKCGKRWRRG